MADTVQIRAGAKSNMPALGDRELGWTRDEKDLYIGTQAGNVKVTDKVERDMENKLSARPADAQTTLSESADLASVIETVNGIITAMKASGLMKESEGT